MIDLEFSMISLKFAMRAMDINYRLLMLTWVTTPRKEQLSWLLMLTVGKDDDDDDDGGMK